MPDARHFLLRGLEADATYEIKDVDKAADALRMSGAELMKSGLSVTLPEQPQAAIFTLDKVR